MRMDNSANTQPGVAIKQMNEWGDTKLESASACGALGSA